MSTFYTTKHVASEINRTPKSTRRIMRSIGIACGSGARHTWTKREYTAIVKRVKTRISGDTKKS